MQKKEAMHSNPFIITADYLGPDYFCDRIAETEELEANIRNGRNTVLISSRRMGKSGLISHVFNREFVRSHYRTFSVDLYPTGGLAEMVFLLAKDITGPLKSREQKLLEGFFNVAKSLRAGFKVDPVTGQFVFDLSLGEILRPVDSLKEIFLYLESSDIPCLVSIDEFQQIAEYPEKNVISLLRTHVQKCRKTSFIFAGSDRRMMEKLFHNPSEPFYMSCSPIYLDAIDYDSYLRFATHHFEMAGKVLHEDCFKNIYSVFEGHTWYVQRLLNELFAWTERNEAATAAMGARALDYVVKTYSRTFENQMSVFPDAQKKLLIAVAKEGKAKQVTSISFCRKHALKSPSTVQSALRVLHDRGIIRRDGESYCLANPLFRNWIVSEY